MAKPAIIKRPTQPKCVDCGRTSKQLEHAGMSGTMFGCEFCQKPLCDECSHTIGTGGVYVCDGCWDDCPLPDVS